MAQTIKLKNSSVAAKVPLLADLVYGEVALNYADGKIYYKKSDNTIQSIGFDTVTATTTATTASQVIATFDATLYRTVKLIIQSTDATNYHSTEILAIHNGTTASYTEYATITIGTVCAVYNVDYSSATVRLLATPTSATSTTYKITAQLTKI